MSRRCEIVIDMHTAAFDRPWSYFKTLNNWVMNRSYIIIVTNEELKDEDIPAEFRDKTIVLEDKIPDFQTSGDRLNVNETQFDQIGKIKAQEGNAAEVKTIIPGQLTNFKIAVISSFSYDEPLRDVIGAAAAEPKTIFYITGHFSRANKGLLSNKPDNVIFTGFLRYEDYVHLLTRVDAVIVLTNRDKTMLCGAYESVAVQKPLITSNFEPLKRYFYKGCIFVNNSQDEIRSAIRSVQKGKDQLTEDIAKLKEERTQQWNEKLTRLQSILK
jgi:glycosyltransferase involved in cell wall biosynthesis